MQDLSTRCYHIFTRAASATARSVQIENNFTSAADFVSGVMIGDTEHLPALIRERIVGDDSKVRRQALYFLLR